MITYSDKEYQLTKLIKQGKATMNSDFKQLANWIDKTYDVQTMNIIYDVLDRETPRLEIIFEFESDKMKFLEGSYFMYNEEKRQKITLQAKKMLKDEGLVKRRNFLGFFNQNKPKYESNGLFIFYSAFEPIAKEEANANVPSKQIKELKEQIANEDIWDMVIAFSTIIFFFYTDKQVKENETNGVKEELSKQYFDLLKPYDEFDYFKKDSYSVIIDSKENFDGNYQSSWYDYFQ